MRSLAFPSAPIQCITNSWPCSRHTPRHDTWGLASLVSVAGTGYEAMQSDLLLWSAGWRRLVTGQNMNCFVKGVCRAISSAGLACIHSRETAVLTRIPHLLWVGTRLKETLEPQGIVCTAVKEEKLKHSHGIWVDCLRKSSRGWGGVVKRKNRQRVSEYATVQGLRRKSSFATDLSESRHTSPDSGVLNPRVQPI